MKKNRFIMKSALFALVLGFGFFNDINASRPITMSDIRQTLIQSGPLEDCRDFYRFGMKHVMNEDLNSAQMKNMQGTVDTLNKKLDGPYNNFLSKYPKVRDQLADLGKTKADFYMPYLLPVHTEMNNIKSLYDSFEELLNQHNQSQILGLKNISEMLNSINDNNGVISVYTEEKIEKSVKFGKDYSDCILSNAISVDESNKKLVIYDKTLETFKASEKLQEFKNQYADTASKIKKLHEFMKNMGNFLVNENIFENSSDDQALVKQMQDIQSDLVNKWKTVKNGAKNTFLFLSYIEQLNNQHLANKNKAMFKIDLTNLNTTVEKMMNEILANTQKKPEAAPKVTKTAATTSKATKKKLSPEEKFGSLLMVGESTSDTETVVVSEEKSKVTKTETTDASANTVKETTEENKKTTTTKTVDKEAPDLEIKVDFAKLRYCSNVGDWPAVKNILRPAMGNLYEPDLIYDFGVIAANSSTINDFLKGLKEFTKYKDLKITGKDVPETK